MNSAFINRARCLPSDIHRHILVFLTDEYERIHKHRFAPTLAILNRFHVACGPCRRRNQQEYLCGRCQKQVQVRIQPYLPGPLFINGPNFVFPVPAEVSVGKTILWLQFIFAQLHLDFDWTSSSLPILHLEGTEERTLFISGSVLILRPVRRFHFHHFFFRKPTGLLPSWACTIQENDDRVVFTLQEEKPFSGIPSYQAETQTPTSDHELRFKYLNSFFPR
jgi:hypothetical protein